MGNNSDSRPSWDDYFFEVCKAISKRATCDRGMSGCVIARDRQILSTGYVGSPAGLPHCSEIGHLIKKVVHADGLESEHCMRTVHAEQNAICQAARLGVSIEGATLYCTMTPCCACAMMIINSGIVKVVAKNRYHAGKESEELFRTAGVTLIHYSEEVLTYGKEKRI